MATPTVTPARAAGEGASRLRPLRALRAWLAPNTTRVAKIATLPTDRTLRLRALLALYQGEGWEDAGVPREVYFATAADLAARGHLAGLMGLPSGEART